MRKPLLLAACAVLVLSLGLWANQAPEVDDQYLGGTAGDEILVILRASDLDIDPFDPDAHPLRFELIEGPEHGELVGDLADVRYGAPHEAAVDLIYVPESGFLGEDVIVYTVTDPMGERPAVPATVRIVVTQRIHEGSIAGSWTTNLTIDVENIEISAFQMQLSEVYRTGLLSIGGTAEVKLDAGGGAPTYVFDTLKLFGNIRMGSWTHDSLVLFNPEAANPADWFDSWLATSSVSFGDVMLEHSAFLSGVQSDSYQAFSLSTTVGGVSVSNTLLLEAVPGCGYPFSEDTVQASWRWCDLGLSAAANFTCNGFEELRLRAAGIPIPHVENWLPGLALDATLIYSLDEEGKVLKSSVKADSDLFDCIEVLVDVDVATAGTVVIGDISIYGLKIDQTFDNGVRFVSATSLDASRNSQVTGQPDYFELVSLSGPLTLCCNLPGTWRVSTYFQSDEASLFGWGMTSLKVDGRLASHFNLSTELIYRHTTGVFVNDPPLEWVIAASVLW